MEIREFLKEIGFAPEFVDLIQKASISFDFKELQSYRERLISAPTDIENVHTLEKALAPDEDGIKMLAYMVQCALQSRDLYRQKGIPASVFLDTMKFLPRFFESDLKLFGHPVFRWAWWFPRQLALKEFRIGIFEYEMTCRENSDVLSLHIPSDALLTDENIRQSFSDAHAFFAKFYPSYADVGVFCETWLLTPCLKELLPSSSRILHFQTFFDILHTDDNSPAFYDWVFPGAPENIKDLPENTSLQKNAKTYLLSGKKIGWTLGKLKDGYFA